MKKLQEYTRYLDSMKKVENGHWVAKSDLKEFIENDRAEQLIIADVNHQREQLKAFADFIQSDTSHLNYDFKDLIQEYLDSL